MKEEVEKAAYEVLAEIGSDHLVDIILNEVALSDKMKFMAYSVLGDELPIRALPWLGEKSASEGSPFDIFAIEVIRRLGTKEAIFHLVKNASGSFMEDIDVPPPGIGLLLSVAAIGVVSSKQAINRDLAASLITAPFLPIEALFISPKLLQKGQSSLYRIFVVAELIEKHGLSELEKLYNPSFINAAPRDERTSVMGTIASSCLLVGKTPPLMIDAIKNVIYNPKRRYFGDHISAAILAYALMQYSQDQKKSDFNEPIMHALVDTDKTVRQSAVASVFYLNYLPAMDLALKQVTIRDARFMPALAFCALYHENSQCKSAFDQIGRSGNNEVKKAVGNWREIIAFWKSN